MSGRPFRLRVRDRLVENLALKVLAFAFALALFAFSHGAQDAQRTFTVDVVAMLPSETDQRVLMTPLPQVRVTVAGSRSLLDELRAEDLGALRLDLRGGDIERLDLEPSMIHVPFGAQATRIDPPSISLQWEDEITRDIPIQASITGQPAHGFVVVGPPTVEPSSVRATGPRSLVEPIQFARADAFDVSNLNRADSYTRVLAIDRPPARVSYDVETTSARIDVSRETLARRFIKVPVEVIGVAKGSAWPREVDVEVKGPPEVVNMLRPGQIVPVVDLAAAGVNLTTPGSTMAPVTVELEGCTAQVIPHKVTVRWP